MGSTVGTRCFSVDLWQVSRYPRIAMQMPQSVDCTSVVGAFGGSRLENGISGATY
jgi:hypothetical protein